MIQSLEEAKGWLVGLAGFLSAWIGWSRLKHRRDEKAAKVLDDRFDAKAEASQVAGVGEAISEKLRQVAQALSDHESLDEKRFDRHHQAILDLFGKHEKTQTLILEAERRASDRHSELMREVARAARR